MDASPGSLIGRYKVLQEIGEGGFGVVYMAEQTEPVTRRVALKVIKLGMDTKEVVARFEAERQALALMDHPNIAKVLDGGATDQGRPYFVMELVKGVPVTEYCDKAGLDTAERLALFQDVCHAVQHAHQKGVIHRDIKPTNVLVTQQDGRPVPKVIDFGIAKATDRRLTEKTLFTDFHQIVGTPEYMAPEQAEMTSVDVDTRADIYSLGVLLYELLTGTKPFDLKSLLEKGYGEILRTIREVEPPRPSTRLSTMGDLLPGIAKQRHTEPKLLGKVIRGDLDWIVMKAMEKDRSRRYDTATAFADDIARYLTDLPVLASPPSRAYRLRKYVRRHRVGVGMAAAVLLALVAGVAVALMGWKEASLQADAARVAEAEAAAQRDEAEDEAAKANEILGVLREMLESASPYEEPDPDYTVRQLLLDFETGLGDRLEGRPEVEAAIRTTIASALLDLSLYDDAERNLRRAERVLDANRPETAAQLVETRRGQALLHKARGQYEEAEELLRQARKTLVTLHGPDHFSVAEITSDLGSVLDDMGRYEEAEGCHREAAAMLRRLGGKALAELPRVLNNLAMAQNLLGRHAEAERTQREALERYGESHGRDRALYAVALNNLAQVLSSQARYDEAVALLEESLELRRRRLPEDHPAIATILNNLGLIEIKRGDFDLGEKYLTEALEFRRRRLGKAHPATLTSQNNLAVSYVDRGEFEKAEPLLRTLVEERTRALGPDHPNTVTTMLSLGNCVSLLGRHREAEKILLDALARARRSVGEEHRYYAALVVDLGANYRRMGDLGRAEEYTRRGLELRERLLGEDHPLVARSLNNLGVLLQSKGDHQESARVLERACALTRNRLGDDHPDLAQALRNLAFSIWQGGDPAGALPHIREARDILVRKLGAASAPAIASGTALANLLAKLGDNAEAERLCEEMISEPDVPDRLRDGVLAALGLSRLGLRKFDEAEATLRECVELRRKSMPDHWLLWNAVSMLGECLAGQGNFEKAEPLLLESYEKMEPPSPPMRELRKGEALERIVRLYDAWGKPEKAAEWRAKAESDQEER